MNIKNYKEFWNAFDKNNIHPKGGLAEELLKWVREYHDNKQECILELGSGFGRTKTNNRIGIDIRKSFLKEDGGRVVLGNLKHLPFKDNSFGLAYSAWVLMHIHPDDVQGVIDEIKRVCHGYMILLELGEYVKSDFCFFHDYQNLFNKDCFKYKLLSTEMDGIKPHRKQVLMSFQV